MAYRLTCRPTTSCRLTHVNRTERSRMFSSSQEKLSSPDVIMQKITYLKERQQQVSKNSSRMMTSSLMCIGIAAAAITYAPPSPFVAIFSVGVAAHGFVSLGDSSSQAKRLEDEIKQAYNELEKSKSDQRSSDQRKSDDPQVTS